jgi:D-alanine transaminase
MPAKGLRVVSIPDERWGRRDIKTIQLLYPSMGKMEALKRGADDSWFLDKQTGLVNEATASNAFIIKGNTVVTRQLTTQILHGITRHAVLESANACGLVVEERPFSIAEAQAADEAFVSAANYFVAPVVEVDGVAVGSGKPGPKTAMLRKAYVDAMLKTAIPTSRL